MSLRMRRAETEALVAVLGAEHDTVEAAAKAAMQAVVELLRERDAFVLGVQVDKGFRLAYGPWWDLRSAERVGAYMPDYPVGIWRMFPVAKTDSWTLVAPPKAACKDCPHPRLAHFPGRGCVVMERDSAGTLSVCGCTS